MSDTNIILNKAEAILKIASQKEYIDCVLQKIMQEMNENQKNNLINVLGKKDTTNISSNDLFNWYCTSIRLQCSRNLLESFLEWVQKEYPDWLLAYPS